MAIFASIKAAGISAIGVVLSPLLSLPPLAAIIVMALLVSLITTLALKFFTNQTLMKALKEEIKALQKKVKELKEKPEESMKIQTQAMEVNMKYMMQSMRSTFITILPVILLLGWMNAHFAFQPIMPGEEFTITLFADEGVAGTIALDKIAPQEGLTVITTSPQQIVDGKAEFGLSGKRGEYVVSFVHSETQETIKKTILITTEHEYAEQIETGDGALTRAVINYEKLVLIPIGFRNWLGWLGVYIIASILFTSLLRKVLKVY